MKFILPLLFMVSGCAAQQVNDMAQKEQQVTIERSSVIAKSSWDHGSPKCKDNIDKSHDVYTHSAQTFIIRQNKCLTFEAPFIYVFTGNEKILILDTGALEATPAHSLLTEIENAVGENAFANKEIVVIHSHGHSDHYKGDASFQALPNVKLIEPSIASLNNYFGFNDWPKGQATINLGDREITIIPTPGHQDAAITVYDDKTQCLMTGDSLYAGLVYVKNWEAYRDSIQTLSNFANKHNVAAVMGAHIEMTKKTSVYYPIGSTYQPDEANLDLNVEELHSLNEQLTRAEDPVEIEFDRFVIKPMSGFQKTLSNMAEWLKK